MLNISWRESRLHCVKSVRIQSYSGPYFRAFELNTDQNNSKYGNFLCSVNPTNWLIQFLREISSNIIYDHYFLRKFRKCQSSSIFSNVQANNIQLSNWTNVNSVTMKQTKWIFWTLPNLIPSVTEGDSFHYSSRQLHVQS